MKQNFKGIGKKILGVLLAITAFLSISMHIAEFGVKQWDKRKALPEPTLVELVEDSPEIQRHIEDIIHFGGDEDEYRFDRVGICISSNYNKGLYVQITMTSDMKIIAVNEVRKPSIASMSESLKVLNAFHFNDFIKEIEQSDSTQGTMIIDYSNPSENENIKRHMIGAGLKAIVEEGLYRKPRNKNQKRYLFGAVIVSIITKDHTFTQEELDIIKSKTETIAALIELLWVLKNKNNERY